MHPVILGHLAHDHVAALVQEADADRLASLVQDAEAHPGVRHRAGLRLIALGNRLACDDAPGLTPTRGRA